MGSNTIIRQLDTSQSFGNVVSPFYDAAQSTSASVGRSPAAVGLSPPQEVNFDSYYQETSENFPAGDGLSPCSSLTTPTTEAAPGLIRAFPGSQLVVVEQITLIAEGSFGKISSGVVMTGQDSSVTVVLKQPRKDAPRMPTGKESIWQAMREEAQMQAICAQGSQHIVKVLGVCYDSFVIFLEYCEGGDLAAALLRLRLESACNAQFGGLPPRLPSSYRLQLLQQAASALKHIHDCGILHNDLRAANCVLVPPAKDADGGSWLLKVTDFGLACELASGADGVDAAPHHTNELWAAPEVIRYCRLPTTVPGGRCCSASKAADVYCFGGLLYEVLTGRYPHYKNDADSLPPNYKARAAAWHASDSQKQPWQLELTEEVQLLCPEDIDAATRAALAAVLRHCCARTAQGRWSAATLQEHLAKMQPAGH